MFSLVSRHITIPPKFGCRAGRLSTPGRLGLLNGNGGGGGKTNTLYFAAGLPGAGMVGDHGSFGSLAPVFPVEFTGGASVNSNVTLNWYHD